MQKFLWTRAKSTAIFIRIRPDPCKRDQSMVESGVIEGGKNTASFFYRERTQQRKHEASS